MRSLTALILLSGAAFAQPGTVPKFTAAEILATKHSYLPIVKGPFFGDGRYEVRYATLVDLIRIAYGMDPERIVGGPNWIEYDRFDVIAIGPKGSTAESRKLMLQSLMADRFGLKIHTDTKPIAAYKLTAGKNVKLQESDGSETRCDFKVENMPPPGPPPAPGESQQPMQIPTLAYTCKATTMAAFASALIDMPAAGQYFDSGKPVVDQTELQGKYDFTVRYTPKMGPNAATKGENLPLFDSLEKQLGLHLELSTAPVTVIVVDAAIEKPAQPTAEEATGGGRGDGGGGPAEVKNGRVILQGIPLQNLITIAWNLNPFDEIAGAPKWLNSDRFDLIAKAPEGVALGDLTQLAGRRGGIPLNIDALAPMIKSLVIERFKMQFHMEDRPQNSYTLTALKPKLTKADPNGRTKWIEGPGLDGKDPRKANPILGRLVTCQNMTMKQFASLLQEIAPGYIRTAVVDNTGLEGAWDFTFNFSGAGALQGGGGRGDGAPASDAASDPNGALSLLDALPKQLGLKLESQKKPTPTLVIDHIEQKPAEN
jgi:uncharacterized protein (TIGR03435 family)